jgi:hypothetical protein
VAYRAQNFQIIEHVVFIVAVFMVNTKNFWVRVVSTPLATFYIAPFSHSLANGGKSWAPNFFLCFVNALLRTVFSFVRRRVQKTNAAVRAFVLRCSFLGHCFSIARRRTVLGFVSPAGNMSKFCGAHPTC